MYLQVAAQPMGGLVQRWHAARAPLHTQRSARMSVAGESSLGNVLLQLSAVPAGGKAGLP